MSATRLSIELTNANNVRFVMKGDKKVIADMIRHILDERIDVVPVFAGAVLSWFKDRGIDPHEFLNSS